MAILTPSSFEVAGVANPYGHRIPTWAKAVRIGKAATRFSFDQYEGWTYAGDCDGMVLPIPVDANGRRPIYVFTTGDGGVAFLREVPVIGTAGRQLVEGEGQPCWALDMSGEEIATGLVVTTAGGVFYSQSIPATADALIVELQNTGANSALVELWSAGDVCSGVLASHTFTASDTRQFFLCNSVEGFSSTRLTTAPFVPRTLSLYGAATGDDTAFTVSVYTRRTQS